jgi:hypothetical protein
MLYDVALALSGSSQLANPLPLRRLQLLPPALAAAAMNAEPSQGSAATLQQQLDHPQGITADGAAATNSSSSLSRTGSRTLLVSAASSSSIAAGTAAAAAAAAAGGEVDGDVYEASEAPHAASWRYFMPGVILDVASKTIGRMQLDLQVDGRGCFLG